MEALAAQGEIMETWATLPMFISIEQVEMVAPAIRGPREARVVPAGLAAVV